MLAAKAFGSAASIRKSTNEVAEQILNAVRVREETVRALELLSLFANLEPDAEPEGFDQLAELLVHMKCELAYEHLVRAAEQHLVERSRGRMTAQPLRIANYLALRRFAYLRPSTIIAFLAGAEPNRSDSRLARCARFAGVPTRSPRWSAASSIAAGCATKRRRSGPTPRRISPCTRHDDARAVFRVDLHLARRSGSARHLAGVAKGAP